MAKKRNSIELLEANITYTLERNLYKIICFFPLKMSVDVMVYEDGAKAKIKNIPFAHLPKQIKKIIKPN
ncbi:hypothetical protein [Sulfurimonas sp.]|jgi:hypothetical protein|uniref:hypothetical protein n=1 Tax=Sulfurimonas sp. TaxID=2022749 RepID=UPI0025D96E42|nr:hypothetical protein [Sulfurimonas sp.]MCK9473762.1 hypothetical protein [Sulfurimonas sp.]MDD3505095.1 hypothetical protein [Sulfurimonas sp.]